MSVERSWAEKSGPILEGRLKEVVYELPLAERTAFLDHLHGGTSAEWLARTLKNAGHPIGATTLKSYRAAARDMEGR